MAALRITNSLSPFRWSVGKPETANDPSAQLQLRWESFTDIFRAARRSSPIFPSIPKLPLKRTRWGGSVLQGSGVLSRGCEGFSCLQPAHSSGSPHAQAPREPQPRAGGRWAVGPLGTPGRGCLPARVLLEGNPAKYGGNGHPENTSPLSRQPGAGYLRWQGTSCGTSPWWGSPHWLPPWQWRMQRQLTRRCVCCRAPGRTS